MGGYAYFVREAKAILENPGVFHQPKLVWIVPRLIYITTGLSETVQDIVQDCVRSRVIT